MGKAQTGWDKLAARKNKDNSDLLGEEEGLELRLDVPVGEFRDIGTNEEEEKDDGITLPIVHRIACLSRRVCVPTRSDLLLMSSCLAPLSPASNTVDATTMPPDALSHSSEPLLVGFPVELFGLS